MKHHEAVPDLVSVEWFQISHTAPHTAPNDNLVLPVRGVRRWSAGHVNTIDPYFYFPQILQCHIYVITAVETYLVLR
jgi:hypothetical protein